MKRTLLHIMRYFLPILFVSYLASVTLFSHVHVVDGITFVHSHPYKKGATHQHSVFELLHIQLLSQLTTDGAALAFGLALFVPFLLCLLLGLPVKVFCPAPYHGVASLRAPPVVC